MAFSITPPLLPIVTPLGAEAPSAGTKSSPLREQFEGVSNHSRVGSLLQGIANGVGQGLRAIGSGLLRAFESIGNPFRTEVQAAPVPAQAPQIGSALLLDAAERALSNTIPKLTAMLQPDAGPVDLGVLRDAYRTLGAGTNTFQKLVGMAPADVRSGLGPEVARLAGHDTVIVRGVTAEGETKTQVWQRLERGHLEREHDGAEPATQDPSRDADIQFFNDPHVRRQLLWHVDEVREMAVAFTVGMGEPERSARIDALGRNERAAP